MRVQCLKTLGSGSGFRATDSIGAMNHLTLKVRELNSISINNANATNPRCS
jgi:hypothetical protein